MRAYSPASVVISSKDRKKGAGKTGASRGNTGASVVVALIGPKTSVAGSVNPWVNQSINGLNSAETARLGTGRGTVLLG